MYEYFEFNIEDAQFEWDEEKDHLNKMIRVDEEHPGEERYNILGRVGKVLFVVCTLRKRNTIRIISARLASLPERERYEDGEYEF